MTVDSELETSPPATEDEIIREVTEKFQKEDQSDEEDDENDSLTVAPAPVTCDEAKAALDVLNRFLMETDTHDSELRLHSQYRKVIQSKTNQKLRQVTLERFFLNDLHKGGDGSDRIGGTRDICCIRKPSPRPFQSLRERKK